MVNLKCGELVILILNQHCGRIRWYLNLFCRNVHYENYFVFTFLKLIFLLYLFRIETILDSDRVLVMSDARVAEFDRPAILLENSDTLFARLVQQSNYAGQSIHCNC